MKLGHREDGDAAGFFIAEDAVSKQHTYQALVLLAVLLCLTGCGSDAGGDDLIIPESPLPFPDTPDKLMQNFLTTYESMNFTEFTRMTDPAFVTILQQSTTTRFPTVGTTLDVLEEKRIHGRMFSRQSVVDPLGSTVPGIQIIEFLTFARQSAWTTSPPGDAIPNTTTALYDVELRLDRGQPASMLAVLGTIRFYVTQRDSVVRGAHRPYYQMVGQVDLTDPGFDKALRLTAWGTVTALFR
jgi:hypothetical protein